MVTQPSARICCHGDLCAHFFGLPTFLLASVFSVSVVCVSLYGCLSLALSTAGVCWTFRCGVFLQETRLLLSGLFLPFHPLLTNSLGSFEEPHTILFPHVPLSPLHTPLSCVCYSATNYFSLAFVDVIKTTLREAALKEK